MDKSAPNGAVEPDGTLDDFVRLGLNGNMGFKEVGTSYCGYRIYRPEDRFFSLRPITILHQDMSRFLGYDFRGFVVSECPPRLWFANDLKIPSKIVLQGEGVIAKYVSERPVSTWYEQDVISKLTLIENLQASDLPNLL